MAIPLILGGALAVGGFISSRNQAKRQNAYARQLQIQRNEQFYRNVEHQQKTMDFYTRRYQETAKNANADADQQYATVFEAIEQRKRQAAGTIDRYARQAAQASGRFRTLNTETAGQSKQLALQQFALTEARAPNVIHENLKGFMSQSQRRLNAIQAQAQNRVNAAMPAPMQPIYPGDQVQTVRQPGGMDLALSLGNVFASTYAATAAGMPEGSTSGDTLGRMFTL